MKDKLKDQALHIVTGAGGFIGARLTHKLLSEGQNVLGIDKVDYFKSRKCSESFISHPHFTMLDREEFLKQLPTLKPTTIFHLGACSNTLESREDYMLRWNFHYSQKLWQLCTKLSIPFVYASSAATYGDGSQGYSDSPELIPQLKPLNLYGKSKQLFDLYVMENQNEAPPHWAGLKFFNVYGPGEAHKNNMASVVYKSFCQFRERSFTQLFRSHHPGYKDGGQLRDFIFVDDVVDVLLFLADHKTQGIFNLGSGKARTFKDLAVAVAENLKMKPDIRYIDMPLEMRDRYQYFTEARMESLRQIGYTKEFYSLEAGIQKYVEELKNSL